MVGPWPHAPLGSVRCAYKAAVEHADIIKHAWALVLALHLCWCGENENNVC